MSVGAISLKISTMAYLKTVLLLSASSFFQSTVFCSLDLNCLRMLDRLPGVITDAFHEHLFTFARPVALTDG